MTTRIVLSTGLLIVGVMLVAMTAETGIVAFAVAGYLMLLFVPALIADAVRRQGR